MAKFDIVDRSSDGTPRERERTKAEVAEMQAAAMAALGELPGTVSIGLVAVRVRDSDGRLMSAVEVLHHPTVANDKAFLDRIVEETMERWLAGVKGGRE